MNTIIVVNWVRNTITVSFTDIENVAYTIDLGKVLTLRGVCARIRRVLFDRYGIALTRMNLVKSTNAIDCFRSNRVEDWLEVNEMNVGVDVYTGRRVPVDYYRAGRKGE